MQKFLRSKVDSVIKIQSQANNNKKRELNYHKFVIHNLPLQGILSNFGNAYAFVCLAGHVDVVNLLLKHNSKVDHQTKTGCTPLMEATRFAHA